MESRVEKIKGRESSMKKGKKAINSIPQGNINHSLLMKHGCKQMKMEAMECLVCHVKKLGIFLAGDRKS